MNNRKWSEIKKAIKICAEQKCDMTCNRCAYWCENNRVWMCPIQIFELINNNIEKLEKYIKNANAFAIARTTIPLSQITDEFNITKKNKK